jgi:hypothetical protein
LNLLASAQLMGGPPNLLPSAAVLAKVQVPPVSGQLVLDLANLFTLQQATSNIQSVLGVDPFGVNAAAQIRAALQPLQMLAQFTSQSTASVSPSWGILAPISAQTMTQIQALVSMNLNALTNLKLPNLAPLAMLASINLQYPIASATRCYNGCPLGL